MKKNVGRAARRRTQRGDRRPTRMTEYQRNRQAEAPSGRLKVRAHLHDLDLNALAEQEAAGVFEAVPCQVDGCGEAIEWNPELEAWQHHGTRSLYCAGGRGAATPPEDLDDDDEDDSESEDDTPIVSAERPPRVDGNPYDTEFARAVLAGLQEKRTYQGSVQPDEIERRRLRNRDAKRSRRLMRKARVKRSSSRHHGAAALIAFTLAVLGLFMSSPAQADSGAERAYLDTLNAFGFVIYDTSAALGTGYMICEELNTATGDRVAYELYLTSTYADLPTLESAAAWVLAAGLNLCPWHYHPERVTT